MIEDSKLIAALRDSDAITEGDLERARQLSDNTGRPLYHTLIDNELADESTTVRIAAELLNVPYVELSDLRPDPEVLEQVPATLAFRNRVFPLKIKENDGQRELFLAMADPIDVLAMDEVATHTGIDIRPVLAGPRDLQDALERAYQRDAKGPEPLEDVEPFDADFDLDEISSFDQDSSLDEDSWEAFFDEAEEAEEEELEDSMVLSREMRDRRTSQELEPFEVVEDVDESEADEDEALQSLEEPLSESQMTGGVEADLSDWEIDERLEGAEETQEEKDYAAIGSFFVYSSEDARKERLQDLADFKDRESSEQKAVRKQDASQADTSSSDISAPAPDLESDNLEEVSGVTSMSKAPFMFDESEADDPSDSVPSQALADSDSDADDDDDGSHTMVGRGLGLTDEEADARQSDDEPDEDDDSHTMIGQGIGLAPESSVEESAPESSDEQGDGMTSMVGGPMGIGIDEESDEQVDLEEDSDGGHTMIGSLHGAEQDQKDTVDGEMDVLDEGDFEILEEPSEVDEDDFGSQTQFGVVPQAESGAPDDEPTDEELEAMGNDSQAPLAQQFKPGNKVGGRDSNVTDDEKESGEEDTKSRLSGLLSKVRDKKARQKTETSENRAATSDEAADETDDSPRPSTETSEAPVAEAQGTETSADPDDDEDEIRETRPNRAVTFLRAQAMQEDAGLSAVFARHVADVTDLDDDEIQALSELSADELVYVMMLALFEKGVLDPRDILEQFSDED